MPIRKGCNSVAHMMTVPVCIASFPKGGAHKAASVAPTPMVTRGVTRISTFVSPAASFPISLVAMATKSTAKGPPAPPSALVANPTVRSE